MYKSILLVTVLLVTCSCSNRVKHAVGIVTPGPDEYKVQKNRPLDMPPHYELPQPVSSQNLESTENCGH